jgi:hypothetical protein
MLNFSVAKKSLPMVDKLKLAIPIQRAIDPVRFGLPLVRTAAYSGLRGASLT